MKECFMLFHLNTGDNFIVYGMVRYFATVYDVVHIFCLPRNIETVTQMYEPYSNIKIHQTVEFTHCNVPDSDLNNAVSNCTNEYDIIRSGGHSRIPMERAFWRSFYFQVGLPYHVRYLYNTMNRHLDREKALYDKIVKLYGTKYIFVHDHRHIKDFHLNARPSINLQGKELPIFHPNTNYSNDDKWTPDLLSNNIFDYGMTMENATELYLTDSAFACLACYIDVSKVSKKVVYTHLQLDMIDMHKSFAQNWIITTTSPS